MVVEWNYLFYGKVTGMKSGLFMTEMGKIEDRMDILTPEEHHPNRADTKKKKYCILKTVNGK